MPRRAGASYKLHSQASWPALKTTSFEAWSAVELADEPAPLLIRHLIDKGASLASAAAVLADEPAPLLPRLPR